MAEQADASAVRAEYMDALAELTFNSKAHINMLTMLAGDHKAMARAVVDAVDGKIMVSAALSKRHQARELKIGSGLGAGA